MVIMTWNCDTPIYKYELSGGPLFMWPWFLCQYQVICLLSRRWCYSIRHDPFCQIQKKLYFSKSPIQFPVYVIRIPSSGHPLTKLNRLFDQDLGTIVNLFSIGDLGEGHGLITSKGYDLTWEFSVYFLQARSSALNSMFYGFRHWYMSPRVGQFWQHTFPRVSGFLLQYITGPMLISEL
jgi:hypothetical protein